MEIKIRTLSDSEVDETLKGLKLATDRLDRRQCQQILFNLGTVWLDTEFADKRAGSMFV
jgi:hypothetical protein